MTHIWTGKFSCVSPPHAIERTGKTQLVGQSNTLVGVSKYYRKHLLQLTGSSLLNGVT